MTTTPSRAHCIAHGLGLLCVLAGGTILADPWAAPGDVRLRHDLQLLADAGLLRAPLTSWPVAWPEVARDLSAAVMPADWPAHLAGSWARVRAAATAATRTGDWRVEGRAAGSANPMTLRRFGTVPREEGELGGALQFTGERFAVRLQGTLAADPADDQEFRPDGSYLGLVLGNWILSAGWLDRWWGPGWEGSLIYGTNQRPIPAVSLERNFSDPFATRWLAWLGPWRLHLTAGRLEGDRADAPHARFLGFRVTAKPHPRLEVGASRSAQWCGDGRPCGLDTLWDLIVGNDNDQPLEEQPGNQLGGFDLRWSVPALPVALYAQAVGEDEAGRLPSKYLGLAGVELWGGFGSRTWRLHLEYGNTACRFHESPPDYGCAYRSVIYTDGYQFRDRAIGHAIDGDSVQLALGALLVNSDGSSWELALQTARINRGEANPVHSVSTVRQQRESADLYHRRRLGPGELKAGIGLERRVDSTPSASGTDGRATLEWTWYPGSGGRH